VCFGNAESDAILEAISKELNEKKRQQLYKKLHALIHNEVPYIFLLSQHQTIAIHKKYENAKVCSFTPGYWAAGLRNAALD
jgi:ABC-type transport system substrate-binding protein